MNSDSKNFRVGLFVLIGLALVLAFTLVLGGQDLFDEPILAETFFNESVQGLEVGSPVKFRGVKLGAVSEIGLVADHYQFATHEERARYGQAVMVRMDFYRTEDGRSGVDSDRLRETLSTLIEQGMRLRLTQLGLTGTSYIEADILDPGNHAPPELAWTPRELYIPSARSTIQSLSSAAERFMAKLERAQIDQVIMGLDEVLASLDQQLDSLDLATLQDSLNGLVGELRETNAKLDEAFKSLDYDALGRVLVLWGHHAD